MKRGNLLQCEIMTIITSPLNIIFSLFFPIFMLQIMYNAIVGDIPEAGVEMFGITLFLSYLLIIPMALILMGFTTDTAEQRISGVLRRLHLFGFSYGKIISHKILANLLVLLFCITIYVILGVSVLPLPAPNISSLITSIAALTLLTFLLFLIGSIIALVVPNNGTALSLSLIIYFTIMIFSGLMGVSPDTMPRAVQVASKTLPTYHIVHKIPPYWVSGGLNGGTLFLYLFFYISTFSVMLLLVSRKRTRRVT